MQLTGAFAAVLLLSCLACAQAACPYTIRGGDTFWAISQAKGTTVAAIQAANPGVNPNALSIGQIIRLPSCSGGSSTTPTNTGAPGPQ